MQISSAKRSVDARGAFSLARDPKESIKIENSNGERMLPWNKPRKEQIGVGDGTRLTEKDI
jgi:hypothetical protein